ncbi:MAG: hypothetical protein JWP97_5932 [Labilithrix sp.]|nr:hypothetical protein [Labilithrix sp.]
MRISLAAAAAVAMTALACSSGADAGATADDDLSEHKERDVLTRSALPLLEVSGLDGRNGHYVAIGDRSTGIVTFDLADSGDPVNVQLHDTGEKAGKNGSQWEAVALDGDGNIAVLSETGSLELFDRTAERSLGSFAVDYESVDSFVPGHVQKNSLGEGLVLLEEGHILVAIEKSPTAIVEMGPKGASPLGFARGQRLTGRFTPGEGKLVALAAWQVDDHGSTPDVSDLTIGPDGALWALTQQGRAFVRLGDTLRPDEKSVKVKEVYPLGKSLTYAEGLVFDDQSRPLVGRDRDKESKNLYVLSAVKGR